MPSVCCPQQISPEVKYSDLICREGVYLGLADIGQLAVESQVAVLVTAWDKEEFKLTDLRVSLPELKDKLPAPDLSSGKTWVICFCCADYEKMIMYEINHTLPMFSKQQCGKDWEKKTQAVLAKQTNRMARINAQIEMCESEEDDIIKNSLEDTLRVWKSKRIFFKAMVDQGFLPVDVPADGNCCCWSLVTLRAGVKGKAVDNPKAKAFQIRQEHWFENTCKFLFPLHLFVQIHSQICNDWFRWLVPRNSNDVFMFC